MAPGGRAGATEAAVPAAGSYELPLSTARESGAGVAEASAGINETGAEADAATLVSNACAR